MTQSTTLMGLYTRTSLHAGAGTGDGIIDLPIQREGHSGWPCVYGSGVKGALRHHAQKRKQHGTSNADIDAIFGPEHAAAESNAYAGALLVGDARLVLLPVRSLTTCYRHVTCPALLKRLAADARRLNLNIGELPCPVPEPGSALVAQDTKGDLFLEEFCFTAQTKPELETSAAIIASLAPAQSADDIRDRLTVVSDDDFAFLANHATPVAAHIAIESETKSVKRGALWYEETLPPETLLVCALAATQARREKAQIPADAVLGSVQDLFTAHSYLQLGGNETVGMGWCELRFSPVPTPGART